MKGEKQIQFAGLQKVQLQRFFTELIGYKVTEEKELKIRTAQNVKVPWKDAGGPAFISPLTSETQDLFLLNLKYIAFFSNI